MAFRRTSTPRVFAVLQRQLSICSAVIAIIFCTTSFATTDGIRPDATMLQYPDVSDSHIVFSYANDLWLVPRKGGTANKIASPAGQVLLSRFSPDGNTVAFMGNYEGDLDLYTLPIDGVNPSDTANRVTYHPSTELLSGWTPDGESLLFSSNGFNRTEIITGVYPDNPSENSVILLCNSEGIVQKLKGYTGDYAFRQENKLII